MREQLRVLVVGAGIMGLSAAWALSARGFAVEVLDAAPPPNPRGASVDHHRLIRHAYGAQHHYMRMVDAAYAAWARMFADLGEHPLIETGILATDEGQGRTAWLQESRAAMRAHGLVVEDLPPAALPARFPWISAEAVKDAFFAPRGGVLLAGRIVELLARRLAPLITQARVVEVGDGRLRLADGRWLSADWVVVAAGPWAPRLLPGLAGRVTASRQVVVRLAPPQDLAEAWVRAPMLLDLSLEGGFYLVPPVAGTPIKIGDHSFTLQGDAEADDRAARPEEVSALLALAGRRIPGLERYRILGALACYYDVEPREEFILEPIAPRTVVMSGFSGHGFKFGAVLGEALANALADPALLPALGPWAAGRAAPAPGLLAPPRPELAA
ncbi:MAG: FAD-dependent oxidoreductase [Rhodovarius sp.]|nr:FAD-dependent oxidoreductase [Rhodovarius sp.]MDW8314044.1 FAD-dependent oxidoreductase [Rhodovarius sp.]